MYLDWDWHGARSSLVRARQLSPGFEFSHNLYAIYCTAIGKKEEAVAACRKALELDPLSPQTNTYLGMFLLRAGRVEKALHQFKEALELDPDQPQAHWLRGQALVISQRHREGIQEIEEALSLSDENPMIQAGLGWAYGVAGRRDDAIQVLRALEKRSRKEYIRPYLLAKVYCGMGETEEAFAHLAMAYEEWDRKLVFITTDETLADLNFDNRFGGLLKKMGLSEIL